MHKTFQLTPITLQRQLILIIVNNLFSKGSSFFLLLCVGVTISTSTYTSIESESEPALFSRIITHNTIHTQRNHNIVYSTGKSPTKVPTGPLSLGTTAYVTHSIIIHYKVRVAVTFECNKI